jgi:hypothetical protein
MSLKGGLRGTYSNRSTPSEDTGAGHVSSCQFEPSQIGEYMLWLRKHKGDQPAIVRDFEKQPLR